MVKLNKIYTRTGDDGSTGLVDGSRVSKADPRMAAIGDVDEANSAIGVARAAIGPGSFSEMLARIQNDLFDLGADLATPVEIEGALRIVPGQIEWLEERIDHLNTALDPLTSFILPAGEPGAAALHLARAVVRRAERTTVAAGAQVALRPEALTYLNRLSDLLFVAARAMNLNGAGDVLWVPGASR
ncbi:cob(I)yrinic acid a,c-diamide adenosyltransferase [Sphingomonas gei]|uniref:Corrinoid adenosyltransferase n=1 Tax=Sphingomonas gei TaxID=1395960 RepID=A0A4V3QZA6_9SPHN|nr:cob(I)yrinic acid a,c-diamide adenosyltransferase [Sphingomonas gei]TGX53452.1 cob(I)yrinic acid a,c-diamide adenosyltransferase [Sphingomonas gei]